MSEYKCKCGNTSDFFIEHNLSQCGLYCGECGKWIKWLNKDEERLFKHKQNKFFNFDAVLEIEKKKSYNQALEDIRNLTFRDITYTDSLNDRTELRELIDGLIK